MRFTICCFITLIIYNTSSAQSGTKVIGSNYQMQDYISDLEKSGTNKSKYIGSFLLFDDWENNCSIQLDGKKYALDRVNFNIKNNQFIYKTDENNILAIAPKYIDFVHVKNKIFKYLLYKGEYDFFEVLFESKERLSLFKGYHIRILPKSELGMLNRPKDEILKEEKFYVLNGDDPVVLKLKKKDVLKLIDKDMQDTILKYIKEKNLSFKKEKDVLEIFKYYDKI